MRADCTQRCESSDIMTTEKEHWQLWWNTCWSQPSAGVGPDEVMIAGYGSQTAWWRAGWTAAGRPVNRKGTGDMDSQTSHNLRDLTLAMSANCLESSSVKRFPDWIISWLYEWQRPRISCKQWFICRHMEERSQTDCMVPFWRFQFMDSMIVTHWFHEEEAMSEKSSEETVVSKSYGFKVLNGSNLLTQNTKLGLNHIHLWCKIVNNHQENQEVG